MPIKKMKKYASFDLWLADRSAKHKKLVTVLRKLVTKTSKKLSESVKWGNGCWVDGDIPVIYLYDGDDHLQFGFFNGSRLTDPKKLLIGEGKHVRHVKVYTAADIDPVVLAKFIRQAVKLG